MSKTVKTQRTRTHYEWVEDHGLGSRWVLIPGEPTRPQRVVGWIVWHCCELAGVLAPAVLAVAVTPWLWLASGAVAAGWAVYEVWLACEQAAIKAGRDRPAVIDTDAPQSAGSDVDSVVDEVTIVGPSAVADKPVGVWL